VSLKNRQRLTADSPRLWRVMTEVEFPALLKQNDQGHCRLVARHKAAFTCSRTWRRYRQVSVL